MPYVKVIALSLFFILNKKIIMTNFKCLLLANLLVFTSMTVFSQVKIIPSGKTIVGNERPGNDYNNECSQEFLGLGTDPYRAGGKIAIGDYGSAQNGGANVFIGEAWGWDSDQLELHGKNGIFFSVNGSNGILGAQLNGYGDLDVTHTVSALSYVTRSDERLKKNLKKMNGAMLMVTKLQGLTYDLTNASIDSALLALSKVTPKEEKEIKDLDKFKKSLTDKKSEYLNQMGFSAQEVQKVFPQIVKKDEKGYLGVNYIALIPLLTEAIKEQQVTIDAQRAEMDVMKKDLAAIKLKLGIK
jgi:Chaperone of endosialidase